MEVAQLLPLLLGLAVLAPLVSFFAILTVGPWMGKAGRCAGYLSVAAILTSFVLSMTALGIWVAHHRPAGATGSLPAGARLCRERGPDALYDGLPRPSPSKRPGLPTASEGHRTGFPTSVETETAGGEKPPAAYSGRWYTLGEFGKLRITIGYYIDALGVCMFCMVTLIASCIHIYSLGYMHEELEDVTDPEVATRDGATLVRPGRFHRFFQYMSLFSFSMLGLVVSGNVAMTFVFWELVGICSYFLIGFYIERKTATNAGNKAFIVNRVGDFGMIVGLMAIWASLGTFNFGDVPVQRADGIAATEPGLFSMVRSEENDFELRVPERMVESAGGSRAGYWLLIVAGVGIFCGCVGKSAQFPLHTWLPDAMEGPTPVSALVHSATMVAAGVFLVARFYPFFAPEVLLVVAVVGAITLFMAATIAVTATDIKRVLAYSTISQLGYMMLALGVGGWLAGVLHLFTHAFFKSLLFLCSGSVIHAVHTNEMPQMGGLLKKMPWTAGTMLVGCLAISGAGIPFVVGLSGYYSKDAILEQAFSFAMNPAIANPTWCWVFFYAAAAGAVITAFYMFRLWYLTFLGKPRDEHRFEHAHESPWVMVAPLVVLAVFAVGVAWRPFDLNLSNLLEQARYPGAVAAGEGALVAVGWPSEHLSHAPEIKVPVTWTAFFTGLVGFVAATLFYALRYLDPEEARRQFRAIHRFLLNKWWFDELYERVFVRPVLMVSAVAAACDRRLIDGLIDGLAWCVRAFSDLWSRLVDVRVVDGLANLVARWTYAAGLSLRGVQTGRIRQYVMFIVVATVAIFILVSFFWSYT